jgi:hypothetical protein
MSKGEDVKKKIQDTIDIVKDFDEPYRSKAFELILSKSLEMPPTERVVKPSKKDEKPVSRKEKIVKFAEATILSVNQLENVFAFDEDEIKFITPLEGSTPQRQVSFTQCVLIGLEYVYNKRSIEAAELVSMLDYYGLTTNNLARSLRQNSDIFRKIGKKRSTKYRLTDIGKTSALALVNTLATMGTQS